MEVPGNTKYGGRLERQLANLKLISRLLTHELHSQGGAKTITLSRDEVNEIKTTIELFVEEVGRRPGSGSTRPATDTTPVNPRSN